MNEQWIKDAAKEWAGWFYSVRRTSIFSSEVDKLEQIIAAHAPRYQSQPELLEKILAHIEDRKTMVTGNPTLTAELTTLAAEIQWMAAPRYEPALHERLKHISVLVTGNEHALLDMTPQQVDETIHTYTKENK